MQKLIYNLDLNNIKTSFLCFSNSQKVWEIKITNFRWLVLNYNLKSIAINLKWKINKKWDKY